jgi:hypothetical protein
LVLIVCRSIASSRKRKLRELFAVATDQDGIPNFDFSDPDAPTTTPAEEKFLNDCDILRYVPLPSSIMLVLLRHDHVASSLGILIQSIPSAGVGD